MLPYDNYRTIITVAWNTISLSYAPYISSMSYISRVLKLTFAPVLALSIFVDVFTLTVILLLVPFSWVTSSSKDCSVLLTYSTEPDMRLLVAIAATTSIEVISPSEITKSACFPPDYPEKYGFYPVLPGLPMR